MKIWSRPEGFRVSGMPDCGDVQIENSFEKIVIPQGRCDLHADGVQGYYGARVSIVNTTIDFREAGCGLQPSSCRGPGQHERHRRPAPRDGRRLPVPDGRARGRVSGLRIVDRSWVYGPIDVGCSQPQRVGRRIVRITPDYQVTRTVRSAALQHAGRGLGAYQRTTWGESAPAM